MTCGTGTLEGSGETGIGNGCGWAGGACRRGVEEPDANVALAGVMGDVGLDLLSLMRLPLGRIDTLKLLALALLEVRSWPMFRPSPTLLGLSGSSPLPGEPGAPGPASRALLVESLA